jgi:hypothetical protein
VDELTRPSRALTGQFLIDADALNENGMTDFSQYRHPGVSEDELIVDFFVEEPGAGVRYPVSEPDLQISDHQLTRSPDQICRSPPHKITSSKRLLPPSTCRIR